jgi:hypothetical protein
MMENGKSRKRRQLSPEEKWEIFLEVTSQEISQADAARKWRVDVSVIIRLRALYVVAYEDDGREVGTRRADEVLTAASKNGGRALLFDFTRNTVLTVAVSPSDPQYHEFATQQQAQMTTAVPGGSR